VDDAPAPAPAPAPVEDAPPPPVEQREPAGDLGPADEPGGQDDLDEEAPSPEPTTPVADLSVTPSAENVSSGDSVTLTVGGLPPGATATLTVTPSNESSDAASATPLCSHATGPCEVSENGDIVFVIEGNPNSTITLPSGSTPRALRRTTPTWARWCRTPSP
jgi:hypothetical protein